MTRWKPQTRTDDADQLMLFTPGPQRLTEPRAPSPVPGKRETSRAAAALVTRSGAATQRTRILHFVASRSTHGATRDEIVATLGMDVQTVTPRVLELIRLEQLRETGETRNTRKGRAAAVLTVSAIGFQVSERPEARHLKPET